LINFTTTNDTNMYVKKNFSLIEVLRFSGIHIIWISIYATIVTALIEFFHFDWLHIPWLPLSVIGTAVALICGRNTYGQ